MATVAAMATISLTVGESFGDQDIDVSPVILISSSRKQVETSCPKPKPKHKIFLSHSGSQKAFVELLCEDLESVNYPAFFDKLPGSLPTGEEFKTKIFKAARKCQVAVMLLSQEFLSHYWPMVELAAFVDAQKSKNTSMLLLPLFYKVTVEDLKPKNVEAKWKKKWLEILRKNCEGDDVKAKAVVEKWTESVLYVSEKCGVSFEAIVKNPKVMNPEVKYRAEIVKAIFRGSPPDLLYDTSKILGCDRICKELTNKFQQDTRSSAKVLGLYGMAGLGKTTMSKCLHNRFIQQYLGRACHIEFKDGMTAFDRQKIVMKKLLRLHKKYIESVSDVSQGWDALESDRMKEYPVFLVIDNVQPDNESKEEVEKYLNVKYHSDSRILVISRSSDVVEGLLKASRYCCEIPCLTDEEAECVLLQQVDRFLTDAEKIVAKSFVKAAWYSHPGSRQTEFDGDESSGRKKRGHYHPMSLTALGDHFCRTNLSDDLSLKTHLREYKLKDTIQPYERTLYVLGLQFKNLDKVAQLMFLDICLYASKAFEAPMLSIWSLKHWLANIHEVPVAVVESKIFGLKRSAMINIEGEKIFIHDLFKELATRYLGEDTDEFRGVWCVGNQTDLDNFLPLELRRTPPGRCWPALKRILLENILCGGLPVGKVQEWCNVVVLQIVGCHNLTAINLQAFSCLRHLELKRLRKLKTFILTEDDTGDIHSVPKGTSSGHRQYLLPPLQFVTIDGLPSLECLPSFSPFTCLQFLKILNCEGLTQPLKVQGCSGLKRMYLSWHSNQKTLPSLYGLTSLQHLTIERAAGSKSVKGTDRVLMLEGLRSLVSLRALELDDIPVGPGLAGLDNLTRVERIRLEKLHYLMWLPPLNNLVSLYPDALEVRECDFLDNAKELLGRSRGLRRFRGSVELTGGLCAPLALDFHSRALMLASASSLLSPEDDLS